MNASNILFANGLSRQDGAKWMNDGQYDRAVRLAAVAAVHAVLVASLVFAMHRVTRPVQADVAVRLIETPRPLPIQDPVPLPLARMTVPVTLPRIEIPLAPAVETPPAAVTSTAQALAPEGKPAAPAAPASAGAGGAGDSAPLVDASAAGNAKPVYPRASKALGEQGVVTLEVFVTIDGTVGDIRISRSSGYDRLDESALRAVRQWHFIPARQGGKQISMWYTQPITFDLKSA